MARIKRKPKGRTGRSKIKKSPRSAVAAPGRGRTALKAKGGRKGVTVTSSRKIGGTTRKRASTQPKYPGPPLYSEMKRTTPKTSPYGEKRRKTPKAGRRRRR